MSNELDALMDIDPLELSDQDLDKIIAYQRKARANREAGIKPKKESGPKIDLATLMSTRGVELETETKPKPTGVRRI